MYTMYSVSSWQSFTVLIWASTPSEVILAEVTQMRNTCPSVCVCGGGGIVCMCTHIFQISIDRQISYFSSTRCTHLLSQDWYIFTTNMLGTHLAEKQKVCASYLGRGARGVTNILIVAKIIIFALTIVVTLSELNLHT